MSLATNLAQIPNITVNRIPRATATGFANSAIFDNGTNVGIGNTNTTYTFDVTGTGRFTGNVILASSSGTASIGITPQTDKLFVYNASGTNTGLTIQQDGTGDIFRANGNSGANRFVVQQGGNVGIGTNNPTERLQLTGLNGDIRIYGRSGISENQITSNVYYNGSAWVRDNASYGAASVTLSSLGIITFNTTAATTGFPDERIRITPTGTVGVGTTNPLGRFDIVDSNYNQYTLRVQSSAGNNANGWGGIGFSGEGANTKAAILFLSDGGSYSRGSLIFCNNNDFNQNNATPSNERMRITSGGTVVIGTPSANSSGATLQVEGTGAFGPLSLRFANAASGRLWKVGPDGSNNFVIYNENNTGAYINYSSTSWTGNSDIRLKNVISTITDAVSKLAILNPIIFSWKSDESNKENLGLIAQDVEKVFPQLIDVNSQGMLGVRYTELIPVLVKAIQEQQEEINSLKSQLGGK